MSAKDLGRRCRPIGMVVPLLRHQVELGHLGLWPTRRAAPRHYQRELRYPATAFTDAIDARSTVFGGGWRTLGYLAGRPVAWPP